MSDVFNSEQAKRLFGFISVGGTLGGIVGGALTASLVRHIGTENLLIISATLLEGGAYFFYHFARARARDREGLKFHGRFLRLENFWAQNGATPRKAAPMRNG